MNKKIVKLYMDILKKILKKDKIEDYQDIRKEILEKCKKDNKYRSLEYLELELERVELELEEKKSPYISIVYAIIIFAIPSMVSIALKAFNVDLNSLGNSTWKIVFLYSLCAMLLFCIDIINRVREYKCYYIYKNLLEKLKKEKLKVSDKNE